MTQAGTGRAQLNNGKETFVHRLSRTLGRWLSVSLVVWTSQAALGGSMDPLSLQELNAAANLTRPSTPAYSSRSLRPAADSSAPAPATLLIERRETEKRDSNSRLADVYVYHYDSSELEHSIVDLNTHTVVKTSRSQGTQLPLIEDEIDRAAALLFDDDEQFTLINAEYQRIVGKPLTDRSALNVKAFTFMADNLPQKVNQAASECGIRRCAQLLIYTDTKLIFEITPIVDLSANIVIQNIGF